MARVPPTSRSIRHGSCSFRQYQRTVRLGQESLMPGRVIRISNSPAKIGIMKHQIRLAALCVLGASYGLLACSGSDANTGSGSQEAVEGNPSTPGTGSAGTCTGNQLSKASTAWEKAKSLAQKYDPDGCGPDNEDPVYLGTIAGNARAAM